MLTGETEEDLPAIVDPVKVDVNPRSCAWVASVSVTPPAEIDIYKPEFSLLTPLPEFRKDSFDGIVTFGVHIGKC